jgi:hypothetical protein
VTGAGPGADTTQASAIAGIVDLHARPRVAGRKKRDSPFFSATYRRRQ